MPLLPRKLRRRPGTIWRLGQQRALRLRQYGAIHRTLAFLAAWRQCQHADLAGVRPDFRRGPLHSACRLQLRVAWLWTQDGFALPGREVMRRSLLAVLFTLALAAVAQNVAYTPDPEWRPPADAVARPNPLAG